MTIDINKKYRSRDGYEVRLYAVDGGRNKDIVHGAVRYPVEGWHPHTWTAKGKFFKFDSDSDNDLVEIKPRIKQKVWVNVYPDHCLGAYREKRHADEMSAPHRIGCVQVEIDIEEGEGL